MKQYRVDLRRVRWLHSKAIEADKLAAALKIMMKCHLRTNVEGLNRLR